MDNAFTTLVATAPSAAAVIYVVILFLKHLKEDRDCREREEVLRNSVLETLGKSCHDFQLELSERSEKRDRRVQDAIDRNTAALANNTTMLGRASHVIESIDRHMEGMTSDRNERHDRPKPQGGAGT